MYAFPTIPRGGIREAMRPPVQEPFFGIVIRPPARVPAEARRNRQDEASSSASVSLREP